MRVMAMWLVAAVVMASAGDAQAVIITDPSAFSGGETVVTFSDVVIGNTITAAGGVTIKNDATYIGHASHDLLLRTGQPYGWLFDGKPSTDGAFRDGTPRSDFSIYFDVPVNRVGMVLSGMDATTKWFLEAYDAIGNLIDDGEVQGVETQVGWNHVYPVFVGFDSSVAISRVRVFEDPAVSNGQLTIMDDLRFEAVAPQAVPEPASLVVWATGGLICGAIRMRRKANAAQTA